MKKYILLLFFPFVISCSTSQSEYEKAIADYLQTGNGIKTDLKIEFLEMKVSDITVTDSIAILQKRFDAERTKKIESAEKSIKHWQESIEKQKGKKNQLVAKAIISNSTEKLEIAKTELKKAQEWKPGYLSRYESRNPSDILAQKAESRFSFMNPKLQTRQEMNALFILSADGKQCYKMIKQ
ncbi:hypothetical protein [Dysgonomonas sp. 511]|uniref:hypothetical protein n=1 Tax=Dysgonomonas sp. 511 TaxID=2302930 RepID=UPI0013D85173|nr:hypothetical protein [Dysgonomonas sp. 511]NDV77718.1 hypothetical protein [Dysgonomonas sp. 511]